MVCKANIGLLSRKFECAICKMDTCKYHYVVRKNSVFHCENCEKNIIKSSVFSDYEYQISALQRDLEYISKDRNKYKREILVKDGIISRLESQLKNNQIAHESKLEILDGKISEEKAMQRTQELLFEHLKNTSVESGKSEELMVEKLNLSTSELENCKIDLEELLADQGYITCQIEKLNSELQGQVPISRLKFITCTGCYKKVKLNFWEIMRQAFIIEGRDSLLASISRPSVLSPECINQENESCKCCII